MKKVYIISWCVLSALLCVQPLMQNVAAEMLKITRDQFEFRDAPRVAEETLLGTLRVGTPVEWSGEASGGWLKIQAPNGQLGWVHNSGLSQPKTAVKKITQAKTSTASRSIAPARASNQTNAETRKIEQQNKQYQALIAEKERSISELTQEIESLEEKLTDVARLIDDQEQLYNVNEMKTTELNREITALQETLKEKDEAFLTEKVELTKLRNQFKALQTYSGSARSREWYLLYALSLPLNALGLVLLGFWGIRRTRRQKAENDALETVIREREKAQPLMDSEQEQEIIFSGTIDRPVEEDVYTEQSETSELEELNVTMAGTGLPEQANEVYEQSSAQEDDEELLDEEVVIDLADVLPLEAHNDMQPDEENPPPPVTQDEEVEVEILDHAPEQTEIDEDVEEYILKEMEEVENEILKQEMQQHASQENQEIALPLENLQEELEEEADVTLPIDEEEEETGPSFQATNHLMEEDKHGETGEHTEQPTERPRPERKKEAESFLSARRPSGGKRELPAKEDTSNTRNAGVIQARNLSATSREERTRGAALSQGRPRQQQEEPYEELFEGDMDDLLKDTQEMEQDVSLDELLDEGDLEDVREPLRETVEIEGETFEMLIERNTQIIESEEDEAIEAEIVPEETVAEQAHPKVVQTEDVPSLLEPSPILIEPEYDEPEEITPPAEPRYDIELLNAGENKNHIIHILSKIEGLTNPPQNLVENTPCIIARGAKENDAKNFQVVMKKFGSEVRLIEV